MWAISPHESRARILLAPHAKPPEEAAMNTRRFAISLAGVLGALASCGGEQRAPIVPPVAETHLQVGKLRPAGATLGVSDDLATACKLRLDNPATAPKFDFDKSEVLPADREVLAKVAECLTAGPLRGRSVRLIGRADARGEQQYNMVLGAHRASGVADYLAQAGLNRAKVDLTSRGALDAVGVDEQDLSADRRVDILLAQ
jgi:peptidoglycan-associated lipoprotein